MYLPLRFLDQMDSYIKVPGKDSIRAVINKLSIQVVADIMNKYENFVFDTYAHCKDFLNDRKIEIEQSVLDNWSSIVRYYKDNALLMCELDEDFMNVILFTHIRNEWRKRKIVYKVSSNLQDTLIGMKLNKLVGISCIANLPSDYFYIDYSDGKGFCGSDKGCMLACHKSESNITIECVLLLDNDRVNTVIISIGIDLSGAGDNTAIFMTADDTKEEVPVSVDGVSCIFNEKQFKTFLLNFFTYMYAVNKDVEVTERASKLINKRSAIKVKEPANKYKEIEDYNVGFRYVKKPAGKVKYIYEDGYEHKHAAASKCTHYRQAHWHSYWTGKGNNKKLIVKWVEGTIVNGTEAKNVTVKEV